MTIIMQVVKKTNKNKLENNAIFNEIRKDKNNMSCAASCAAVHSKILRSKTKMKHRFASHKNIIGNRNILM
jgi:hypothetical protein